MMMMGFCNLIALLSYNSELFASELFSCTFLAYIYIVCVGGEGDYLILISKFLAHNHQLVQAVKCSFAYITLERQVFLTQHDVWL